HQAAQPGHARLVATPRAGALPAAVDPGPRRRLQVRGRRAPPAPAGDAGALPHRIQHRLVRAGGPDRAATDRPRPGDPEPGALSPWLRLVSSVQAIPIPRW